MAGIKDLKDRLNSVKANKQITKAMQLVSTAKMRSAVKKQQEVTEYFNTILTSTHAIMQNLGSEKSPWLENSTVGKKGYVLLTSDMGLCGGFNQNIIKEFLNTSKDTIKEDIYLFVFGKKGVEKLKFAGYNIDIKYINIMDASNSGHAQRVAGVIAEKFLAKEIRSVEVIYTHFINALESEVRVINLLPLNMSNHEGEFETKAISGTTLIEPDIQAVLESLVEQYLVGILYSTFINSIASEQTARRNSMENATKNADELADELTKVVNRERQAKITQEISEIVSGSESLKN